MQINQIKKHHYVLLVIMILGFLLNFLFAGKSGDGNLYYTAAVKSMLSNIHNFFFVSFDKAAYVTVDKPPLGLWIQSISALMFGFSTWSVILPQALAGAFSSALLYLLVRPYFGKAAGLLAAFVLTFTPIFTALNRTNHLDSLLILFILLALYYLQKAVKTSGFHWLLLSAFIMGLGFNIKMMQAFLVLPAFFFFYILCSNMKKKLLKSVSALVLLLVVSFSWAIIVDSLPQENRPYIGSSQTNSVIELTLGYNGLLRIVPAPLLDFLLKNNSPGSENAFSEKTSQKKTDLQTEKPASQGIMGKMGNGKPGLFRLFNKQMGGQISWFFILALFAFPAVILNIIKEKRYVKNPAISQLMQRALNEISDVIHLYDLKQIL